MGNFITIQELKKQLNIESTYTDEDVYLQSLIDVSCLSVDNYTNMGLSGYTASTMPSNIKQAALLLASHLYINRTIVSFSQGVEIPYTFQFLLNQDKNFVVN